MSYSAVITATPGLISYYPMDEASGTTCIDSFGPNSGTYSGGFTLNVASLTALGKAVTFNGTTGIATIPDSASLHLTAPFTLEAWVKTTSAGANIHVFGKHSGSTPFSGYGLNMELGKAAIWVGDVVNGTVRGTVTVNDNAWHHVVVQLLADNTTCNIYVDGVFDHSGTKTPSLSNSAVAMVAGDPPTNGADWAGTVTDIAVYGAALSSGTIRAHYEAGVGILRVSAANAVALTPSGGGLTIGAKPASASSGVVASPASTGFVVANRSVAASSGLLVTPAPTGVGVGLRPVAASSGLAITPSPNGYAAIPRPVAASSGLAATSGAHSVGTRRVAATSIFRFYAPGNSYVTPIPLAASTGLALTTVAAVFDTGPRAVAALTAILAGASAGGVARGDRPAAARTLLTFTDLGAGTPHAWHVAAATAVLFADDAGDVAARAWARAARSGFATAAAPSFRANRVPAALAVLMLADLAQATRVVPVAASTGLGLGQGSASNSFIPAPAASSARLVGAASSAVMATPAAAGFRMTDLAIATLHFPWRLVPLTRPPGGGLPHS